MALSNVWSRYVMANGVKTHYSASGDDGVGALVTDGEEGVALLNVDESGGHGLTMARHR